MCFKISATNVDAEELEFELIDAGLDSLEKDEENHLILYSKFSDFGSLQKALEDKNRSAECRTAAHSNYT